MLRQDSRTGSQMRPLACEQSPLSRADGSARFDMGLDQFIRSVECSSSTFWSTGQSSVLAAVYGPTEVSQRKDLADRAVVEVSFKPKVWLSYVLMFNKNIMLLLISKQSHVACSSKRLMTTASSAPLHALSSTINEVIIAICIYIIIYFITIVSTIKKNKNYRVALPGLPKRLLSGRLKKLSMHAFLAICIHTPPSTSLSKCSKTTARCATWHHYYFSLWLFNSY